MKKHFFILFFITMFSFGTKAQTVQEKAILFYEEENFEAAAKSFEELLKKEPNNAIALEYLGDLAYKKDNWDMAASYFKPLLKIEPNNARYHFKYGGALGTKAKHKRMQGLFLLDDVEAHFTKAAELDKEYIDVRVALVEFYIHVPAMLGGSVKKATKYANEIALLDTQKGIEAKQYIEKYK